MKILIAGSGPSAAFAAMAALDWGAELHVMSKTQPHVQQDGAFFIHWLPENWRKAAIQTIEVHPYTVKIRWVGTAEQYTIKQWSMGMPSSFPAHDYEEQWYNSEALNAVWQRTRPLHSDMDSSNLRKCSELYDYVFHTFTVEEHRANRNYTWFPIRSFVREWGQELKIVYNGSTDPWVRMTMSFYGRVSFEFPDTPHTELLLSTEPVWDAMDKAKLRDIHPSIQPVAESEWLAPNVRPLGRFATWDRKRLSHHAYADVMQALTGGKDESAVAAVAAPGTV